MSDFDARRGYGNHYVYALIDPETKIPFYIGKGLGNRACEHVREANQNVAEESGANTEAILNKELNENEEIGKLDKIKLLLQNGFKAADIVRILGRNLREDVAFAIEALLIKHVYGLDKLTNIQDGQRSGRFRDLNRWEHIEGFDLPCTASGDFKKAKTTNTEAKYYVYVLINPEDNKVFYVGKGNNNRLFDHFQDAINHIDNSTTKLDTIRDLLKKNKAPKDIGKIVAWADSDHMAFMIESFYMMFVVGLKNLTNIVAGRNYELFRSHEDWKPRAGFDLAIAMNPGAPRTDLLEMFLGEGLDELLNDVVKILNKEPKKLGLLFEKPDIYGAGELIVKALIPGVPPIPAEKIVETCRPDEVREFSRLSGDQDPKFVVRIQTRLSRRLQVFVHGQRPKIAKKWLAYHFPERLQAPPVHRKDEQYRPDPWKVPQGSIGDTADPEEAARRVKQILQIFQAKSRGDIDDANLYLLEAEDRVRAGSQ